MLCLRADESNGICFAERSERALFKRGDAMDTTVLTVVAIAVILLLALAGVWYFARRKNTERLRERFGPEYDKTVEQLRSQERAEKELTQREKRIRKYTIVALPESEKVRYRETWAAVQARFVDHPESALREAHEL